MQYLKTSPEPLTQGKRVTVSILYCGSYPLISVTVIPFRKAFWEKKKRIRQGRIMTSAAAMYRCQGVPR